MIMVMDLRIFLFIGFCVAVSYNRINIPMHIKVVPVLGHMWRKLFEDYQNCVRNTSELYSQSFVCPETG